MNGNHGNNVIPISARPQPLSQHSAGGTITGQCENLTPATVKQGRAELGACLTLVSPSGMSAEDRTEWLAVAMQTLSGIPDDLLSRGCTAARKKCRFPSEIVPAILAEVEDAWRTRRRLSAQPVASDAPRLAAPDYVSAEEAKTILAEFGLRSLTKRDA